MCRDGYDPRAGWNQKRVPCPRLERALPVSEHCRCPYCFGNEHDVFSGSHERFCDFRPDQDPIAFGFPTTFGRYDHRV